MLRIKNSADGLTMTAGKLSWRLAAHLFHRAVFLHWHSRVGNNHVLRSGAAAATATTCLPRPSPWPRLRSQSVISEKVRDSGDNTRQAGEGEVSNSHLGGREKHI